MMRQSMNLQVTEQWQAPEPVNDNAWISPADRQMGPGYSDRAWMLYESLKRALRANESAGLR
jgi:hypothetical protein